MAIAESLEIVIIIIMIIIINSLFKADVSNSSMLINGLRIMTF